MKNRWPQIRKLWKDAFVPDLPGFDKNSFLQALRQKTWEVFICQFFPLPIIG